MERVIEFRGMAITKEGFTSGQAHWVTGDLLHGRNGETFIRWKNPEDLPPRYIDYLVDPKTVGQFTGCLDENGRKIFEGDIVEKVFRGKRTNFTRVITWDDHDCRFYSKSEIHGDRSLSVTDGVMIIGNIHEKQIAKG